MFPVLTPLAFDPGRPFPHISNRSLNLAVMIRDNEGQERLRESRYRAPCRSSCRWISHRKQTAKRRYRRELHFVWLEQVIIANLEDLFPGMRVDESHPFHITRDAEVAIKELEAEDLLETIEAGLRRAAIRRRSPIDGHGRDAAGDAGHPDVEPGGAASELYRVHGPLSLSRLMDFTDRQA